MPIRCNKCGQKAEVQEGSMCRCACRLSYMDHNGKVCSIPCEPNEIIVLEIPRIQYNTIVSNPVKDDDPHYTITRTVRTYHNKKY